MSAITKPLAKDETLNKLAKDVTLNKLAKDATLNSLKNAVENFTQTFGTNIGNQIVQINHNLEKKVNKPINNPDGTNGQLLRTLGNGATEWVDEGLPTDEQTSEAINAWLNNHPEATTTVQDGSLTEQKFSDSLKLKTLKDYVTPEMFGAVGDGVTPDEDAWQAAANTGKNIIATKKHYRIEMPIEIRHNITIDCNGADFICTQDTLFDCQGSVVEELSGESNYTANSNNYTLQSEGYTDYTGFAAILGDNDFTGINSYYLAGFVCEFFKGRLTTSYPIDVENVTVKIINPITVRFENIGAITHTDPSRSTMSIYIKYGFGCVVRDSEILYGGGYFLFALYYCLNCIIENVNIQAEYGTTGTNSYLVAWLNSSFCTIQNSQMYNRYWHCATTGDIYLCYHNVINNCKMYSETMATYSDHPNGVNTIIKDSVLSCCALCGMAVVENCDIVPVKDSVNGCGIDIYLCCNKELATYKFSNIRLHPLSNTSSCGVSIRTAGTEGEKYYLMRLELDSIYEVGNLGKGSFFNSIVNGAAVEFHSVIIDGSNLNIWLGKKSEQTLFDISNYDLVLRMQGITDSLPTQHNISTK